MRARRNLNYSAVHEERTEPAIGTCVPPYFAARRDIPRFRPGSYLGDRGCGWQENIDAVKARPGILSVFRAESARTAQYDVSGLEGTYSNGLQSNHFTQQRIFTMSGSQPSVVVMGSGLDHMQTGYTYIKKVADSFDVNADIVDVRGNSYTTDTDPEEYARMKSLINTVAEQRR